jgi:adenylate cyclase, class 2
MIGRCLCWKNVESFCAGTGFRLGTETEIKIIIADPEFFCLRLQRLNARLVKARHFEDNRILDFPDGRLQDSRCLLRIRNANDQAILTYKGPARTEGIFKVREELETGIEAGEVGMQILERLGMSVCFRYQKYRREYGVDDVMVAVDETPIGNFSEFEGSEAGILDLARKMRIDPSQFLRASYYSLYMAFCEKAGKTPESMIF